MKRKKTYAFTLIELFVVMALMAIIVGIAIPSMSGTTRQVTLACTEISGQIELARAYAVTHNCYTAVIFPQRDELANSISKKLTGEKTQKLASLAPYFNASCRTAIVVKDAKRDDKYHFVMWVPDSSWKVLSRGAVIAPVDKDESRKIPTFGITVDNIPLGSLLRVAEGNVIEENSLSHSIARCIVFSRGGQLESGDNQSMNNQSMNIFLRPGSYNPATQQFTPFSTNTRYSILSINPRSGRTTVTYR